MGVAAVAVSSVCVATTANKEAETYQTTKIEAVGIMPEDLVWQSGLKLHSIGSAERKENRVRQQKMDSHKWQHHVHS